MAVPYRVPDVPPLDDLIMELARERQSQLTKPAGSLGRLEDISIRLAGMTGLIRPRLRRRAILVFAADHGVAAEGVSAYPSEVTAQMVENFLRGGAAISVLARQIAARLTVVDVGVASSVAPLPGLRNARVRAGTANFTRGPAMSSAEVRLALQAGHDAVAAEVASGLDVLILGEMGIGNTTAASAVVAALTGEPIASLVGRGTGVDEAGIQRKIDAISSGLRLNHPDMTDPVDVLQKVGGLEIVALTGAILASAASRIPVLLDGFITAAAAVAAVGLNPACRDYLIAGHRSVEPGHWLVLERLELFPILDLRLRLGEASGAALAMPILEAAVRLLNGMATFVEAGVSNRAEATSSGDSCPA